MLLRRAPDRVPPRLASLDPTQDAVVVPLIERLALDDCAPERDLALQVMEEWWIPNTLYRKREDEA